MYGKHLPYETRSFKNYDKSAFVRDLAQVPWSNVDSACTGENACVNGAVHLWEHLFFDVADVHTPIKKRRRKGHQTPWVTSKLSEIRRDRDYHHKKARKSNSKYHWACTENCEISQIEKIRGSNRSISATSSMTQRVVVLRCGSPSNK